DTRGGDRRIELAAAPLAHFVRDADRRAARRVFLLRVMPLFHARRVLRKACEELARAPRERERDIRAGRKVRRVNRADAGLFDARTDVVDAIVPAGGADDDATA